MLTAILSLFGVAGCGGGDGSDSSGSDSSGGEWESGEVTQEIVGGSEATPGEWPTAVRIYYNGLAWCGGTVVAPGWVVTAGHCVADDPNPADYEVVVGRHDLTTTDGEEIAVADIVLHPDYTELGGGIAADNDIALLDLGGAADPAPTRLASIARMTEVVPGDETMVVGWGATSQGGLSSDVLLEVGVDVVGVGNVCNSATDYPSPTAGNISVTDNMICIGNLAGGQDSCQGDSGGPAFVRRDSEWFLIGVTSWGEGCAQPDLPGVYTLVPEFLDWVHDNTTGMPAPSHLPSAQIQSAVGTLG